MTSQPALSTLHPLSPYMMLFEVMGGFALDAGVGEKLLGPNWELNGALTTLAGAAGIAYMIWCWRGRSAKARSWAFMPFGAGLAILAVPLFAFSLFGLGLREFLGTPKAVVLSFVGIGMVFGIVYFIGFFDCPKWWGPRWFRRKEFETSGSREIP